MEAVIQKYDYMKGTEEKEQSLVDELDENEEKISEGMNIKTLKKIFTVLIKKICVKGYPVRSSPGCYMASRTITFLGGVMENCIEENKLQQGECRELVFDLLLECLRTGPGSAHSELIDDVLKMGDLDMKEYIEGLRGQQMKRLINVLKEVSHTPEPSDELSVDDQADHWGDCTKDILELVRGEDENKIKEPEVIKEVMDLYLFYFLKISEMPEPYLRQMEYCMDRLDNRENLYQEVKDLDLTRKHLSAIQKVVFQDNFPKYEDQMKLTVDLIKNILKAALSETVIVGLWDDINTFLKSFVLCENASKFQKMIKEFRYFYRDIEADILKKNPKLVQSWCPVFAEIIDKGETEIIELFAEDVVYHIQDNCEPAKGDITFWMPLFKALIKHPTKGTAGVVARTLGNSKFKKIWEWKKNWKLGQELIQAISKVENLPLEEGSGHWDNRNIVGEYANIVNHITDQFGMLKIAGNVALDVANVFISMMEKGSEIVNYMPRSLNSNMPPLQNCQEKIPELLKRFEVIFFDSNYPWTSSDTDSAGETFMDLILRSYKDGAEVPDEVNQILIRIFRHCLEGDVEYIEMEHGTPTIYSILIRSSLCNFINLHNKQDSQAVMVTLMPLMIKMMEFEDEEEIQESAHSFLQILSQTQTAALADYLPNIVKWYKATKSISALSVLFSMYHGLNTESMVDEFPNFFAASVEDPDNVVMQITVFHDAAKKIPQAFTKDMITQILTVHINEMNLKAMVLIILDEVASHFPDRIPVDLLCQKLFKEVQFDQNCSHFIAKLAVNVALCHENHADRIMEEIFKLSQKSMDGMYTVAFINGMRSIAEKYGMEKLKPYRAHFENLKAKGTTSVIKEVASAIIDNLEGRSLAKVSDDVKEQKKEVKVLDKKVTETNKTVVGVKKQVKKQELAITNVKAGLEDVNQRVDEVEEDLGETKVKVEEIDNKTMTNAPAWSRDVTKLMNPETEHDWRLLASRLGYTNNDIRGWATQNDPCMALLSEWYATHKTIEATHGVLTALQEMNRMDAAAIVENAMKAVEDIVEEAPEYATPPPIFLSYQWGHQNEVKLLRNHLRMAGYECWMDIGQMGGGDKLFEKIDSGIRGAKLIICCVSEKYAKSPNCNREVNLSVNLGKPMIPLLMEKMGWPPKGSMGPIFSEYLFVRFFQRAGEETKDDRYWPVPKFQELLMQINLEVPPDDELVTKEYKEWWKPMAEEIIIIKKEDKGQGSRPQQTQDSEKDEDMSPDVFISYQWGKQPQIKQLYRRLTELGFTCWMDIYQMGGGDSLYDKIDRGVRGCKIVLSCVTSKYALSANCRREVSLADSIKKPIVPLLLEKIDWPPTGPMSMVFTQLLFINFYRDEAVQMTWKGDKFEELLGKIKENVPEIEFNDSNESVVDKKTESKGNGKNKPKATEQPKPNSPVKSPVKGKSATSKSAVVASNSEKGKPKAGVTGGQQTPTPNQKAKQESEAQKVSEESPKPEETPKPKETPKPQETPKPEGTPKPENKASESPKPAKKSSACILL